MQDRNIDTLVRVSQVLFRFMMGFHSLAILNFTRFLRSYIPWNKVQPKRRMLVMPWKSEIQKFQNICWQMSFQLKQKWVIRKRAFLRITSLSYYSPKRDQIIRLLCSILFDFIMVLLRKFWVLLVLNYIQAVHKIIEVNHFLYLTHERLPTNVCIYACLNFCLLNFISYLYNVNVASEHFLPYLF